MPPGLYAVAAAGVAVEGFMFAAALEGKLEDWRRFCVRHRRLVSPIRAETHGRHRPIIELVIRWDKPGRSFASDLASQDAGIRRAEASRSLSPQAPLGGAFMRPWHDRFECARGGTEKQWEARAPSHSPMNGLREPMAPRSANPWHLPARFRVVSCQWHHGDLSPSAVPIVHPPRRSLRTEKRAVARFHRRDIYWGLEGQ
ncbi:hypothetical protein CCHR01_14368 [Colletotrichum chrysophilum]|uniref:Uncharacterized protein n=1 Tax=Colletotrichum chrysophilum TaxID=1836956 RepID=A0AAD9A7M5_9PEZI|nr:hypothetical protein K456DRAFT_1759824 [Colletotrichum gloeosporioides 23]KAK1842998.1 hypothetical protein CCHR01_14368 [Colletotrichum chrysophilum]